MSAGILERMHFMLQCRLTCFDHFLPTNRQLVDACHQPFLRVRALLRVFESWD
jgi:hypothetical protein